MSDWMIAGFVVIGLVVFIVLWHCFRVFTDWVREVDRRLDYLDELANNARSDQWAARKDTELLAKHLKVKFEDKRAERVLAND